MKMWPKLWQVTTLNFINPNPLFTDKETVEAA